MMFLSNSSKINLNLEAKKKKKKKKKTRSNETHATSTLQLANDDKQVEMDTSKNDDTLGKKSFASISLTLFSKFHRNGYKGLVRSFCS